MLTLGPAAAVEQLQNALAMGIEQAVLLETDGDDWGPQATAAAIADAVRDRGFDLLLFGNESADNGNYQVAIRVAAALGLPWVTGIKGIEIADGVVRARREAGGGWEVFELPLPCVVGVREGINLPRYPSLPGRLRAKKAEIERIDAGAARGRDARRCGCWSRRRRRRRSRSSATGRAPRRGSRSCCASSGWSLVNLVFVEPGQEELSLAGGRGRAAGSAGRSRRVSFGAVRAEYAPEAWARAIAEAAAGASVVLAAATDRGSELLAYAAAKLDAPLAANCVAVEPGDPLTVTRQRWGGSLLEEARVSGPVKFLTVTPHVFAGEEIEADGS